MLKTVIAEDVGRFFIGTDKEVWKMVAYHGEPTAFFERVSNGERIGGTIWSSTVRAFIPLVAENPNR